MVPDRQQIIRVKLYSQGFATADQLSAKFFQLYQLASEQLSQQRHYDWGLRNILSVLRICGQQLRNSQKDINEEQKEEKPESKKGKQGQKGQEDLESQILKRVLIDMNKSKLVDEDEILFMNLVADLFPGSQNQQVEYPGLKDAIKESCDELGICWQNPDNIINNMKQSQEENKWLISVQQFYETHLVRHGIMILGPPQAGKSQTIYTLAKTMTKLTNNKVKYQVLKLNPKAITNGQLFGILHQPANDWTDGVFSNIFRKCCQIGQKQEQEKPQQQNFYFITFNGPVDAVYIENMNSLLDDSKLLTLANSDRIPMSNNIKLVFEIDSLENASPATVSRAGMIYMSGFKTYGWKMLYVSWTKQWPEDYKNVMNKLLIKSGLIDSIYERLDEKWIPIISIPQLSHMKNFLQILTSLILDGSDKESDILTQQQVKDALDDALSQAQLRVQEGYVNYQQAIQQNIANACKNRFNQITQEKWQKLIVYSLINSFGQILDIQDQKEFDDMIIQWARKNNIQLPEGQNNINLRNYYVDQVGNWNHFQQILEVYEFPDNYYLDFNQILIPTIQNTALKYMLTKLSNSKFNVLLVGESGSSKTQTANDWLVQRQQDERYNFVANRINMSCATSTDIMYNTVMSFIEKRQGNIYGPKNQYQSIMFIDDLNIPEINEWGDQPTNEFVRQCIEERGFYNIAKPGDFINITDYSFIVSMPTPSGGKNDIPNRLKAQFVIQKVGIPDNDTIQYIYNTILQKHFTEQKGFSPQLPELIDQIVSLMIQIWNDAKQKFLPTPQKFHYNFNMRDLSRIVQGMLKCTSEGITNTTQFIHLWFNEMFRIISDKFIDLIDVESFVNIIKQDIEQAKCSQIIKDEAQIMLKQVMHECHDDQIQLEDNEYHYFADFMRDPPDEIPEGVDFEDIVPKVYEEVSSKQAMIDRLIYYQQQYNNDSQNRHSIKLDMVFFDSCIQHILRINRIIRIPKQHALLVGVGGSGKTSCSRLASYIAGYKVETLKIERNYGLQQLDDDLRRIYMAAGLSTTGVSFLITDQDIKNDIFLERINNLLTQGEIPALYPKDQQDNICNLVRPLYKKQYPKGSETQAELWKFFINNATNRLHIILLFSPVGDKFSTRARKFPGIINCTTLDWFHSWSEIAMTQVAQKKIQQIQLQNVSQENVQKLPQLFSFMHEFTNKCTLSYFTSYRRLTYVTPKSYMSFLQTFEKIYSEKLQNLINNKNRLLGGLQTLEKAQSDISIMKVDLQEEKKKLDIVQIEVDKELIKVQAKTKEAEEQSNKASLKAQECELKAKQIEIKQKDAQVILDRAEPAKIEAENALSKVTAAAIANLVNISNPSSIVKRLMDVIIIFLNEKVDKVQLDKDFNGIDNAIQSSYQSHVKSIVQKSDFLSRLQRFDKDSVTDEQCELAKAYIERQADMVDLVAIRRVFRDLDGLLEWTKALCKYHEVMNDYLPKQIELINLTQEFNAALQEKEEADQGLQKAQEELRKVQEDFNVIDRQKQEIQSKVDTAQRRLNAAETLINGLSGEKQRWTEDVKSIDQNIEQLVGTVLLSSAFLSYAGPFNQIYRDKLVNCWIEKIQQLEIPHKQNIDKQLIQFLISEQEIDKYRLNGLPTDDQSTQNALIMNSATRYSLLIDPQSQGYNFLKNMYQDAVFVKQTDFMFRQVIEDALQDGQTVIIEDVDENIDPVLDNVLERNTFKQGKGLQISFNNKNISFDPKFNLYITTRLQRPMFNPETYAKTSIIDFSVTFTGLKEQLLTRTISIEKPDLEEQKQRLLREMQESKQQLTYLEDNLLLKLSQTEGNLLDDESLINVLNQTKTTTENVKQQLETANRNNEKIDKERSSYIPVAVRGANIYFVVTEFTLVNYMYQTSLKVFLQLFDNAIKTAEQSNKNETRIQNVVENITRQPFRYLTRGLYEQHKLLFALDLSIKVDQIDKVISDQEFMIFVRAGALLTGNNIRQKPDKLQFLSDQAWNNVLVLQQCPYFETLQSNMIQNYNQWQKFYLEDRAESAEIPQYTQLNQIDANPLFRFKRLLLIRCLREDRTMLAVSQYISQCLGQEYIEPINNNYSDIILNEQNSLTPILFLLSLGSDPTNQLIQIAKKLKIECNAISMGQGQEQKATEMIMNSAEKGGWVIINNCHLTIKFMTQIQQILDQFRKNNGTENEINNQFRLILTTEPNQQFPISLLQESIKLTNDLPSGMRAGLKRTYNQLNQDTLDSVDKPDYWLPLVYSLAYLHSSIIERKKYGTLGWCTKYEFGEHDFNASLMFIQTYLYGLDTRKKSLAELISYPTIQYMISEVHYGGRITDDFDRRLMNVYTEEYINKTIFTKEFAYGVDLQKSKFVNPYTQNMQQGINQIPQQQIQSIDYIRDYVDKFPAVDTPLMYHMDQNAEIAFRKQETDNTLNALLNMQPKDATSSEGKSREQIVQELAKDLLTQIPQDYPLKQIFKGKLANKQDGSSQKPPLAVFLGQELNRIQKVLSKVRKDLRQVIDAVDGTIVMSDELNQVINSLYDARVPEKWLKISFQYESLGGWITHLKKCCEQYDYWLQSDNCELPAYWINGFFNPTGFITSIKQTIARESMGRGNKISLDKITLGYTVGTKRITTIQEALQQQTSKSQFLIYGIYLEGASWNMSKNILDKQQQKQLQYELPVIIIEAKQQNVAKAGVKRYRCPLYMTPKRTALTYITTIELPTEKPENYWILQGTALLCQKEL